MVSPNTTIRTFYIPIIKSTENSSSVSYGIGAYHYGDITMPLDSEAALIAVSASQPSFWLRFSSTACVRDVRSKVVAVVHVREVEGQRLFSAAPSEERVVSSFPDPPASLYKLYTDENVRSGKAPNPPAPIKGKYHMFGAVFDVSISMNCSTMS